MGQGTGKPQHAHAPLLGLFPRDCCCCEGHQVEENTQNSWVAAEAVLPQPDRDDLSRLSAVALAHDEGGALPAGTQISVWSAEHTYTSEQTSVSESTEADDEFRDSCAAQAATRKPRPPGVPPLVIPRQVSSNSFSDRAAQPGETPPSSQRSEADEEFREDCAAQAAASKPRPPGVPPPVRPVQGVITARAISTARGISSSSSCSSNSDRAAQLGEPPPVSQRIEAAECRAEKANRHSSAAEGFEASRGKFGGG